MPCRILETSDSLVKILLSSLSARSIPKKVAHGSNMSKLKLEMALIFAFRLADGLNAVRRRLEHSSAFWSKWPILILIDSSTDKIAKYYILQTITLKNRNLHWVRKKHWKLTNITQRSTFLSWFSIMFAGRTQVRFLWATWKDEKKVVVVN